MIKKLCIASVVALVVSNAAFAQSAGSGVPNISPGMGAPTGIGTNPGLGGTPAIGPGVGLGRDPADPRSGADRRRRAGDSGPLGTTGGVDSGSVVGGTRDTITGGALPMGPDTVTGVPLGGGTGVIDSGSITGAPRPDPTGAPGTHGGSGFIGGAAGASGGAGIGGVGR